MNIKVDFDNIVVKEDNNDTLVKILMLKGEKGDGGGATKTSELQNDSGFITNEVNDLTNYYKKSETYTKNETNSLLDDKADNSALNNYYEASEIDGLLNNKVDNLALNNYYTKDDTYNQNEINSIISTKANTSDVANTYETIANHNNDINSLSSQISSLASGSPLVANSVSEMTDTTKVYVNTSNGHWYYYDGTSWVDGGTYQATEISDNSISPAKTTFYDIKNFIPLENWVGGKVYFATDGHLGSFNNGICSYNPTHLTVTPGDIYYFYNYYGDLELKIHYWDSSDNYISTASILNNNQTIITIPDNVSYATMSSYHASLTTLPNKVYGNLYEAYLNNINNKNAEIKEEYFNDLSTNDIMLYNNIKIIDNMYNKSVFSSFSLNIKNNTVSFAGTPTASSSTRYAGILIKPKNYQLYDIYNVNSDSGYAFTIYPGTISGAVSTSTAFGNLDFSNSPSSRFTLNQAMIDYLEQDNNNCLTLGFRVLSTDESVAFNLEFGGEQGRTLKDYVDNIATEQTLNCIVLGDSITALTGSRSWLTYFNEIQPINIIQNVAVSGAWLMDKEGTVYDGNPVYNGADNNVNNVLGNQVQKILNNDYDDPDIIIIAIGTNSGLDTTSSNVYDSYYDSNGDLIPLSSLDRKTVAGAFRYCNETLRTKYPNATIFWCSPIYAANIISKPISRVNEWANNLELMCKCGGSQFINTMNCGIVPTTETVDSNGLYLADGLHPNSNGAKYMGYYNATKIKEYTKSAKLLN